MVTPNKGVKFLPAVAEISLTLGPLHYRYISENCEVLK